MSLFPGEQTARFLNDAPFELPQGFSGTMTFQSDVPVAAAALRGYINERSDFLITTLPIAPLDAIPPPAHPVLPHYANGGGWVTEILLVNTTDRIQSGVLRFMNAGGGAVDVVPYTLPGRGARRIPAGGTGTTAQTGSIRIQADTGSGSPLASAIMRFSRDGIVVAEGAILSGAPRKRFRLLADAEGAFSSTQPGSLMTGVAIANPGAAAALVLVTLSGLDGSVYASTNITIPAGGQATQFLKQFPGFSYLQTPFRGLLTLSSTADISVAAVRARYNERNEFLFATTPPADDDVPAGAPLYVPHVVAGGGYSTQFILLERSDTAASVLNIRFTGKSGMPAVLNLH